MMCPRPAEILQEPHQRRLAGAVAADDGVDRVRPGEVDGSLAPRLPNRRVTPRAEADWPEGSARGAESCAGFDKRALFEVSDSRCRRRSDLQFADRISP